MATVNNQRRPKLSIQMWAPADLVCGSMSKELIDQSMFVCAKAVGVRTRKDRCGHRGQTDSAIAVKLIRSTTLSRLPGSDCCYQPPSNYLVITY